MTTFNVPNPVIALALVAILLPSTWAQPGAVNPSGGAAIPQPVAGNPNNAAIQQPGVGSPGTAAISQPGGGSPSGSAAIPQPGAGSPSGSAAISQPGANNPSGGAAGGGAPVVAGPHLFDRSLELDYYKTSCPNAEKIVFDVINKNKDEKSTIPGITRLLFHDCFITGCDASILLETSPSDQAEIAYPANGVSIRGLDVIAQAKAEIEKVCPGRVSCADILAYAARDCAVLSGNPTYPVVGGRRDSLVSRKEDAMNLPGADWPMDKIAAAFAPKNISLEGVVALLGAHSIGVSRCYNTIANKERMARVAGGDQALDPEAKKYVAERCPSIYDGKVPLNLVNESGPWGVSYYKEALRGRVAIPSDLGLMMNPEAKAVSEKFAADPNLWAKEYNQAMMTMGTWGVLTNLHVGEIRTRCGYRNGEKPGDKPAGATPAAGVNPEAGKPGAPAAGVNPEAVKPGAPAAGVNPEAVKPAAPAAGVNPEVVKPAAPAGGNPGAVNPEVKLKK